MIICPLCQKLVYWDRGYASNDDNPVYYLTDSQPDDFYCSTRETLYKGHISSHYQRHTLQGCFPEYRFLAPPFEVIWLEGRGQLTIYDYRFLETHLYQTQDNGATWQEALQWAQRFRRLTVFS